MEKLKGMYMLGAAGIAASCCFSCTEKSPSQPNVIIIYGDDVGYGDLSCNGSTTIHTPNVERLANAGLRFTNAHTVASTSTPARYGMLTGEYPWRKEGTEIARGDAAMIIEPEQYTIADMFQSAGYYTGAVGKWHLGLGSETGKQDWNGFITPGMPDIGFDYSFIMAATGDRVPCVYIENSRVADWDPDHPIVVDFDKPIPGEPTGRNNPELLRIHPHHGHNQAIVDGIPRIGYMKGGGKALWHDEDIADRITEKAVEFIADNKDKPFFLYFGTNDIHVPRVPHERFVGKSGMGPRGDAILSFDASVGAILDALDRLGLAGNTIVILSSDNGPVVNDGYHDMAEELLGDHKPWGPFRGSKYSAFEAGTRVPTIIRWPARIKAGTVSDALVSQIDFLASLASLCGVSIPEGSAPDSRNQLKALIGKDKTGCEFAVELNRFNTLSLVAGDWKYIEPSDKPSYREDVKIELGNSPEDQLYNLKDDLGEKNNIAKQYPEKTEELRNLLVRVEKGYK